MTPDDVRLLIGFLKGRVELEDASSRTVSFVEPTKADMVEAGVHADAIEQVLNAPWWSEMIEEVVETPEYCEAEDTPKEVLGYARDVVSEYVRKRFRLE